MPTGPVAVVEPPTAEMRARIAAPRPDFDLRFPASGAPAHFADVVRDARGPHAAGRTLDGFDRMVSHRAGDFRAHAERRGIDPACLVEP